MGDKTYFLGVTGGIGSGKSSVCKQLEALGAKVFNSDKEAKIIMAEDQEVISLLKKSFGEGCYDSRGLLNRNYLASKVFGHAEQLKKLEDIIHPRVFAAFEKEKEKAIESQIPLLVKEAAILFESGSYRDLDGVLVVITDEELRLKRVLKRNGVSEEQVRSRMKHQLSEKELREKATFVVENNGTEEELKSKVVELFHKLK